FGGWEYEQGSLTNGGGSPYNVRWTTKTTTIDQASTVAETVTYDRSGDALIVSGQTYTQTLGNIVRRTVGDGGQVFRIEEADYIVSADGRYRPLGLWSLPTETRVRDGANQALEVTRFAYDQEAVVPSGAPNLDLGVGPLRGNATTKTAFELAGPARALAT